MSVSFFLLSFSSLEEYAIQTWDYYLFFMAFKQQKSGLNYNTFFFSCNHSIGSKSVRTSLEKWSWCISQARLFVTDSCYQRVLQTPKVSFNQSVIVFPWNKDNWESCFVSIIPWVKLFIRFCSVCVNNILLSGLFWHHHTGRTICSKAAHNKSYPNLNSASM